MRLEDIKDDRLRARIAATLSKGASPVRVPVPIPIVESDPRNAPRKKDEGQAAGKGVIIRVHSIRVRKFDPDNVCPKWTIDCLVTAGILKSDQVPYTKGVYLTGEQVSEAHPTEETIVSIEEAD